MNSDRYDVWPEAKRLLDRIDEAKKAGDKALFCELIIAMMRLLSSDAPPGAMPLTEREIRRFQQALTRLEDDEE